MENCEKRYNTDMENLLALIALILAEALHAAYTLRLRSKIQKLKDATDPEEYEELLRKCTSAYNRAYKMQRKAAALIEEETPESFDGATAPGAGTVESKRRKSATGPGRNLTIEEWEASRKAMMPNLNQMSRADAAALIMRSSHQFPVDRVSLPGPTDTD